MSSLFGEAIRPELDPAQLLDELRAFRPLMDRLEQLRPVIDALTGLTPTRVQELARALDGYRAEFARLEHAAANVHRIEEIVGLLDQMDAIVYRRQ